MVSKENKDAARIEFPFENTALWRFKRKLQFTGWLQYIPTALLALLFFGLSELGHAAGIWQTLFYWTPLSIAWFLTAILVFDLVTVKLDLHPPETIPNPKENLNAFDLMRTRHSCRAFQARLLIPEHRSTVELAVKHYCRKDRLFGKSPIRLEYTEAPLTVWPVVGAQQFLVAIVPKPYDRISVIDVGHSLQKVVMDMTRLGLATCWIGPGADHESIQQHMGDRLDVDKELIICVCALGYASFYKTSIARLSEFVSNKRKPLSELFFTDVEDTRPLDTKAPAMASFGRCFEACQWSPSSYDSQTTRGIAVLSTSAGKERMERLDFYAATNSRFYAPVAVGIWCANWELGCAALGQQGHFEKLSVDELGVSNPPELPRYDISWIAKPHRLLSGASKI